MSIGRKKTNQAPSKKTSAAGSSLLPLAPSDTIVAPTGRSRNACVFDIFFRPDSTPKDLVSNGIYQSIAMALKGGEWRPVSLKMFAKELRNKAAPALDLPDKPSRSGRASMRRSNVALR